MGYRNGWLAAALLAGSVTACGAQARTGGGAVSGEARFLALGDSYTIGEGVDEAARWPLQLAALLSAQGVAIGDPEIIARTGWTTEELGQGIDAAAPQSPFALVTLLIGVNNQYRGQSLESYRTEFRGLLERAVGFAGGAAGRVVVLSIPDWGVTPFAEGRDRQRIGGEIDAFNAAAREITLAAGAHWVDVTPTSRAAGAGVVGDGLHPDAAQYTAWAHLALPAARTALGR
jgi:lysophospholipase L1-like esterase